jgi:hypothetical protein
MSDTSQGPGWWLASDLKWYPPELHPDQLQPQGAQQPGVHQQGEGAETGAGGVVTGVSGHRRHAQGLAGWAPTAAPIPPWEIGITVGQGMPTLAGYPGSGGGATSALPGWGTQTMVRPGPSSGGRFRRGLRLVGIGFSMVRDEPGLMAVPVFAFLIQLAIIGVGTLVLLPAIRSASRAADAANGSTANAIHLSPAQWLVVVAVGVAVTFVSVVSHATIIARVMARFHGERISNVRAAAAALTKSPHLLAWAFINYVVIRVLRSVGRRGILGLLLGSLLRAGWMLASFFVVPVILFEDRGAASSIKRSVQLCRARWGENVIGNSTIGIIGFAAVVADVVVAVVLGSVFAPLGVAVGAIGLVAIVLVVTVASAAFNAALYWFAVTDQTPGRYSVDDLNSAYRRRTRRTSSFGL